MRSIIRLGPYSVGVIVMSRRWYRIVIVCLVLVTVLVMMALWFSRLPALRSMTINRITSYYVYSGVESGHDEKLPVIIFVGHPADSPRRILEFKDKFDEPVLLIWSGLLRNLGHDTPIEDETVWTTKRQEFIELINLYRSRFNIDTNRVYLTGFSTSGVYAWMLAYDRPESYTAVVAMSAVSYPPQIQEHIDAGKNVITVVVRGRQDSMFSRHLEQEMKTGRIIESYNARSKFVLKEGEGHSEVAKYWLGYLKYVLQFSKFHRG